MVQIFVLRPAITTPVVPSVSVLALNTGFVIYRHNFANIVAPFRGQVDGYFVTFLKVYFHCKLFLLEDS
jgi:hypothetical protein